jgi:hypothetical protein
MDMQCSVLPLPATVVQGRRREGLRGVNATEGRPDPRRSSQTPQRSIQAARIRQGSWRPERRARDPSLTMFGDVP